MNKENVNMQVDLLLGLKREIEPSICHNLVGTTRRYAR